MPQRPLPPSDEDLSNPARGERLQRVLADLGVGARRACEKLIEEGRVAVNDEIVRTLPVFVDRARDHLAVDGRPLPKGGHIRRVYVMLHKPERTLTVSADEPGADRRTVLDLVQHPGVSRLYPVGRLEYDATGLVLLTNDGELANRLSHPRYGVEKVFEAVVKGDVPDAALPGLEADIFQAERKAARTQARMKAAGKTFKGEVPPSLRTSKPMKGVYRAAHVSLAVVRRGPGKTLVQITLTEGRNRHLPAVFEQAGYPVKKLTQVGLGPLRLTGLAMGAWRELEREEVSALLRAAKAAAGKSGAARKTAGGKGGPRTAGGGGRGGSVGLGGRGTGEAGVRNADESAGGRNPSKGGGLGPPRRPRVLSGRGR